jgi:predicted MFS family arabinose efflux permease
MLWERHAQHPLIDLALFKNRNFSATNAATLFLYAGFAGFGFVLTVFLQTVGGYSATAAGAAFLPASAILAVLSGRVGALATKYGPRLFMTAGPLLCAAGMLLMWHLVPHVPYLTGVLPGVIVFSLGLALVVAPLTATALNSAPEEKSGIASAINNGVATAGPLIAIALLGLWGPQNIYHYSLALCAGLAALAGLIALIFVRKA